jgi:thioredoxin-related protein
MSFRLEHVANTIIVTCIVIVTGLIIHDRVVGPTNRQEGVAAGDTVAQLGHYKWFDHHQTLLVVLSQGCKFCENSLPFYRQLAKLEMEQNLQTHVLGVFPESAPAVTEYCERNALRFETLFGIDAASLNASGTPTLILVNVKGQVLRAWVGQLSEARQSEVLNAVGR